MFRAIILCFTQFGSSCHSENFNQILETAPFSLHPQGENHSVRRSLVLKNKKREKLKDFASTYSDPSRYGRLDTGVLFSYSITISSAPTPPPPPEKKWEFHHNPFHMMKAKINYHKFVLNGINRKATTSIQQKGQATNSPFAIKTNVHSTWKHSSCFLAQIRTKCSVSTPRLSEYWRVTMYELPGQFTALTSREQAPHKQFKFSLRPKRNSILVD